MTEQFELPIPDMPPATPPRGTGPNSYVPIVKRILGDNISTKDPRYKAEVHMAKVIMSVGFKQKEILEVIDYLSDQRQNKGLPPINSLKLLRWNNYKVLLDTIREIANIPWSAPEMTVQKEEPAPVILDEDQRTSRPEPPKKKRSLVSFLSEWYHQ